MQGVLVEDVSAVPLSGVAAAAAMATTHLGIEIPAGTGVSSEGVAHTFDELTIVTRNRQRQVTGPLGTIVELSFASSTTIIATWMAVVEIAIVVMRFVAKSSSISVEFTF